ncbi:MAG: glycosyltransferase family 2 protein [Planctomycetes bacterium]|jgi:glycosyltransferase involved in cell wall biosynthesis|nr:glycosyltransferase family 2 protein [Planctomycetota bacterium]
MDDRRAEGTTSRGAEGRLSGISCFLPACNEEGNIARTVGEALAVLPAVAHECEVIVVDDGSRDGTAAVAEGLAAGDPRVRVVRHPANRGYGQAVRSGLRAGRLEWLFLTDGDGQFDFADLPRVAALAPGHDAVLGFRRKRRDTFLRRLNGVAWTLLMDLLLRLRVRDVDCAFKLLRREVVAGLPLRSRGAMISAELIARLRRRRARIAEVPVAHRPRLAGTSTGGNPRVILRAFGELLELRRELTRP